MGERKDNVFILYTLDVRLIAYIELNIDAYIRCPYTHAYIYIYIKCLAAAAVAAAAAGNDGDCTVALRTAPL